MIPNVYMFSGSLKPPVVYFWIFLLSPEDSGNSEPPGSWQLERLRRSRRNLGHCWWLLPQQVLPRDVLYPTRTRWPHSTGSCMARHWESCEAKNKEGIKYIQLVLVVVSHAFTKFRRECPSMSFNFLNDFPSWKWVLVCIDMYILYNLYTHIHTTLLFSFENHLRFDQLIPLTCSAGCGLSPQTSLN